MTRVRGSGQILTVAGLLTLALSGTGGAQEAPSGPALTIDLNSLEPSDRGCRFTFVVTNDLDADLSQASFEIAMFDKKGLVDRLTVFDFKALPKGKTRVRQFDIPDTKCDEVSRVLVNDAKQCEGEGIDPAACMSHLRVRSKAGIDVGS